jgi:ABC-type spermidine/putrescine transport system permease subunit I
MADLPRARLWFLIPVSVLLLVGLVWPVYSLVSGIKVSSPESMSRVLSLNVIFHVQMTTLRIAVVVALLSTILATSVTLLIRPLRSAIQRVVLVVCFFPLGVHIAFRVFGVQYLMSYGSPFSSLLRYLFPLWKVDLPSLLFTETATVIGLIHWTFPTAVIVMFPSVLQLREDLLDAASLLGAPWCATLVRLMLPLLLPAILLSFSLTFCLAYGAFITPAALGGLDDITLSRLIGSLFDEGHSDSASLLAVIGIVTPLMIFGAIYLTARWIKRRNAEYQN